MVDMVVMPLESFKGLLAFCPSMRIERKGNSVTVKKGDDITVLRNVVAVKVIEDGPRTVAVTKGMKA